MSNANQTLVGVDFVEILNIGSVEYFSTIFSVYDQKNKEFK
jgi:hypothetical protein